MNYPRFGEPERYGRSDAELFPEVQKPKPDPYGNTMHQESFDLKRLAFSQTFAKGLIDQRLVNVPDVMRDAVTAQLRATMMGKKVPSHEVTESRTFTVNVPASPWQYFKDNHKDSWWLGWLVNRRPVCTTGTYHKATLTATWEQFIGFPWQEVVDHFTEHDRLGPAIRFASVSTNMSVERD